MCVCVMCVAGGGGGRTRAATTRAPGTELELLEFTQGSALIHFSSLITWRAFLYLSST